MQTTRRLGHGVRGLCTLLILTVSSPLAADSLDLSDKPIFLGTAAKANILFLVDDSGSMDWEIVTGDAEFGGTLASNQPDGRNVAGAGPVKHRDADNDGNPDCGFADGTRFAGTPDYRGYFYGVEFARNLYSDNSNDCNTADDRAWRFRNHDFNRLYYDPARLYTPWAGVDAGGDDFGDIDPANAPDDPYAPNDRIDLTGEGSNWLNPGHAGLDGGFRYYIWQDDGDGVFENGEEFEVRVGDLPVTIEEGQSIDITTAGGSLTVTYPNSQTNFANWFAYYRSRELLAKNAYGKVISDARNVRMGLVTLNDNNNVNTRILDIDTGSNKADLLRQLYADFAPSGGTPLRSAMNDCGKYLACDGNPFGFSDACPALSQANGGNCQQNFLVTMTDGYYNGSFSGIGNTDGDDNTDWDGGAYADRYGNTLADIAMHYYENDIQPTLSDDLIPIPGIDEAKHQHMISYTVAFGVDGTVTAMPGDDSQSFPWPNPGPEANKAEKIDDLRHAAYNGRGLFLDSRDPATLASSLRNALADIGDRTSAAAAVALNSGSLNVDTGVYQARFDSGDWSGELLFRPVSNGLGNEPCPSKPTGALCPAIWDAGDKLNQIDWRHDRVILTRNTDTGQATAFLWQNLSSDQKRDLQKNRYGPGYYNANSGRLIFDYLRGDRRLESNPVIRARSSVLGDIVNSTPFYVREPSRHYSINNYSNFKTGHSDRTAMIYVNSNDGMLHGFNADTGVEKIAYVPGEIYGDLNRIVFSNYNRDHHYYVDGSPTVGDAYVNNQWRTILVSGLRGGGQGVFALDVTDPDSFSEDNASNIALWEFTDADDPNLGYTYSQPSIVRLASGKWAAVLSSGYNNTENDGNASSTGRGYLFVLYLDGPGSDGDWDEGTDYRRIALPAASGNTTTPAGVASPAAVNIDDDVEVEYIYVGDLNGNMWRVDVSSADADQWQVSFGGTPLFVAKDGANNRQPITVQPEVGAHPEGIDRGLMVYFGTGRFLVKADNNTADAQTQTFYAIWDENDSDITPSIARGDLVQQTIDDEVAINPNLGDNDPGNDNQAIDCDTAGPPADCFRLTSDNPITYTSQGAVDSDSGSRGWYMDLIVAGSGDNRGERQVSPPILRDDRIIFTTLLPSDTVCGNGGDGWIMELDASDGSRLEFSPFDTNRDEVIDKTDYVAVDTDNDGTPDAHIFVGGRQSRVGIIPQPAILTVPGSRSEYKYLNGSNNNIDSFQENSGGRLGRILWRQIR